MKSLRDGIISFIGNTPLMRLSQAVRGKYRRFAKLEGYNPGGRIKDRPALEIIRDAIDNHQIDQNTVVIESSSGNMGIGLAQVCCYLGLRFICVVDSKITPQNLQLLKTYKAEIEIVTVPDSANGDLLQARINRAHSISKEITNSFWANQYANLSNARAHLRTMDEIFDALAGEVDYLFCAASSCGTIRGCADYLRQKGIRRTKIYVADSPGSIIFGGMRGPRLVPGHGAGIRPTLYQDNLADRSIHVTDFDCVMGCRLLLSTEALLVGGSSGGVFMAMNKVSDEIERDASCVMLFPDRGERYLDTIFSESWVQANFEDIPAGTDSAESLTSISLRQVQQHRDPIINLVGSS
ncbi:MAG TPA: 2,3-diaminopropionate biosynthesis protein SbnA [Acidobacteriaceae bacterium]